MITNDIAYAVRCLSNDELVGMPTETVYGLAGNAFSDQAVRKIYALKQRPLTNPLILHIPSLLYLSEVAKDIPDMALRLATRFWPGPLTLVLNKNDRIPSVVTSGNRTVAVRVPDHPTALALLRKLPFPLAAPSANPFGCISPTTARHVQDYFGDSLSCVLDGGNCSRGLESTIVGFPEGKPVIYRLGALMEEEIRAVCPDLVVNNIASDKPQAPGLFDRHYSPRTPMLLTTTLSAWNSDAAPGTVGFLCFREKPSHGVGHLYEVLSEKGDLAEAARRLYASMHRLDAMGLRLIVAEPFPDYGLGRAINDRLKRAVADSTSNAEL
ncbi:MAG: L-threonylcarbamoyladenylate synthase [Bacteroidota bacterium]